MLRSAPATRCEGRGTLPRWHRPDRPSPTILKLVVFARCAPWLRHTATAPAALHPEPAGMNRTRDRLQVRPLRILLSDSTPKRVAPVSEVLLFVPPTGPAFSRHLPAKPYGDVNSSPPRFKARAEARRMPIGQVIKRLILLPRATRAQAPVRVATQWDPHFPGRLSPLPSVDMGRRIIHGL